MEAGETLKTRWLKLMLKNEGDILTIIRSIKTKYYLLNPSSVGVGVGAELHPHVGWLEDLSQ